MKKFINHNTTNILKWIILVFLVWRVGLFLIVLLGTSIFPLHDGFLGGGTSQKVLYAMSKQNIAFGIILTTGLTSLFLSILLIPTYGIIGAAIATGISLIIWRASEVLLSIKLTRARFPFKFLFKVISTAVVALSISKLVTISSVMDLLFSGCIFFGIYVAMMLFAKPFEIGDKARIEVINSRLGKYFGYFCG